MANSDNLTGIKRNEVLFKKKRLTKCGSTLEGQNIATYRRMAKYAEKPTWKQAIKEVET